MLLATTMEQHVRCFVNFRYFKQLTEGCGKADCKNPFCATGECLVAFGHHGIGIMFFSRYYESHK